MKKVFSPIVISIVLIFVVLITLVHVDDVTSFRRSAALVSLFGPLGALWIFRFIGLSLIGAALWMIRHELRVQKRIDRIFEQRSMTEKRTYHDE